MQASITLRLGRQSAIRIWGRIRDATRVLLPFCAKDLVGNQVLGRMWSRRIRPLNRFYFGAASGTCLCTKYIRAIVTSVIAITR